MNEHKGLMKVVYLDEGKVRSLRGETTLRDDGFVEIKTKKRSILVKKIDVIKMKNIPSDVSDGGKHI